MLYLKTRSGSLYRIDDAKKEWTCMSREADDGRLRTMSGTFLQHSDPKIGEPFALDCPPIVDGASGRLIVTTEVVIISNVLLGVD